MEIKEDDYSVIYNAESKKITFSGTMRLQNLQAYSSIKQLMKDSYASLSSGQSLTLDFSELGFLNSSGITNFSMFILESKKSGTGVNLSVIGSKKVGWQDKSLNNFKKLWPDVAVEIVD